MKNWRTQEKHPLKKSEKNWYSQAWQEQQLVGWRGEDSSSDHHLTVLSHSIHSSGGEEHTAEKQWKKLGQSVFLNGNNSALDFVQGLVTR